MKPLITIFILVFWGLATKANNPYITYLLTKTDGRIKSPVQRYSPKINGTRNWILGYEIPKGAVFCRMENKLMETTRVWIKLGVK